MRDGVTTIPLLLSFALYIEWWIDAILLRPRKLEVALFVDTSTFAFVPGVFSDDHGQRPLVSGVARIYTKREDADHRLFLPVP